MSGSSGGGATNATTWQLGTVSAHYEANGLNPGTVSSGVGDHGGVSYGIYQLSSQAGTVKEHISQSPYGRDSTAFSQGPFLSAVAGRMSPVPTPVSARASATSSPEPTSSHTSTH